MFGLGYEAAGRRLIERQRIVSGGFASLCLLVAFAGGPILAQDATAPIVKPQDGSKEVSQEVVELRALVERLQARVEALEKHSVAQEASGGAAAAANMQSAQLNGAANVAPVPAAVTPSPQSATTNGTPPNVTSASAATASGSAASAAANFLRGTTFNIFVDGYYGYNFNNPIGRVNLLRAYDVSSNAFSLNQAGFVIENAADPENGKRFGMRLDFQYGQATETLQGNPANEPRPEIYRNIFQAYGTYVVPIGKGLTVDFGKFASSLGYEGNYTKDQMNYSRAYWFNFLPFYHMGLRATYNFNDKFGITYWMVNGTQQTEPFNGFKDQFFSFAIQPNKKITWKVNYYLGQEHPDVAYFPNGGAPAGLPTQQGVPFQPIVNSPQGKLHIIDSYATWQMTPKLTLGLEGDYEIERLLTTSTPAHTDGGAAYLQYQWTPKFSMAGRAEYLSDRGGLFTGRDQAIKETTFTTKYAMADAFLVFGEWRRDFSNEAYFFTNTLGVLKREQNTATIGLVWWAGGKQGSW